MADKKTLTFALMDVPYESARTTTALRLLDIAARRGYNIHVFAYEGAGADLNVLLRGNAVNYAVNGQDASGLSFGDWKQTQPPNLASDIGGLVGKGVEVYIASEDLAERGLAGGNLVDGIKQISRSNIPAICDAHDQVWHW